jgi:hypothetical protein
MYQEFCSWPVWSPHARTHARTHAHTHTHRHVSLHFTFFSLLPLRVPSGTCTDCLQVLLLFPVCVLLFRRCPVLVHPAVSYAIWPFVEQHQPALHISIQRLPHRQDSVCRTDRIVCAAQTGQFVPHRQDSVCRTDRIVCAAQTGQCVPHRQDSVCRTDRIVCAAQTGQCVPHRQDSVCRTDMTVCAAQTG